MEEQGLSDTRQKNHLIEWVRQWGGSTSDANLESEVIIFSLPDIAGFIGYRLSHGCAVVFGDPICAPGDIAVLTQAFHQFMDKQNIKIIYLIVTQDFAKWALDNVCGASLEFGAELTLNPLADVTKMRGENARLVRKKVKRATEAGVSIHEYLERNNELEQTIEDIGNTWMKERSGHQFHISKLTLFHNREGKRWFYAKTEDKIVGIVILNLFKAKNGWFLNNLLVIKNAPHGTSELLVISALEILAKEGCNFVTLGMITNSHLGEIMGLNKFSAAIGQIAFKIATKLGRLDGLNIFWSKFNPERKPGYMLFSRKSIGLKELMAIKHFSYSGKR